MRVRVKRLSFFFNDTATTEIYTLSLHDALPIFRGPWRTLADDEHARLARLAVGRAPSGPRRLLHLLQARPTRSEEHTSELQYANISYAVFCLKKKKFIPHLRLDRNSTRLNCNHA